MDEEKVMADNRELGVESAIEGEIEGAGLDGVLLISSGMEIISYDRG
jgi:hypothetical protein